MKHFLLVFSLAFLSCFAQAQTEADTLRHFTADSNIIQDKRVNELMLKHILINEARKEKMNGFRVQIHSGSEKAKAMEIKTKFITQYPDIPAYFDYQQPYFKVRVGNCRTKLEAYKLQQEISGDFPGFIVADEIDLPPL